MGKNGQALRLAKNAKFAEFKYTFTTEELRQHDLKVCQEFQKTHKAELNRQREEINKNIQAYIKTEWDKREQMFHNADEEEKFFLILQYMLSIQVAVMVEHFGWKPERPGHRDGRLRINRLADLLAEEIGKLCSNEEKDIRDYCEQVYRKYGVKFLMADY